MTIEGGMKARTSSSNSLLIPFHYKSLNMRNRFVMAPMTRNFSPNGIPTAEVAAYYRRRAEGNVGLILSEGTVINRPSSANLPGIPRFYGKESLEGWKGVIDSVHEAGGVMGPQIGMWVSGARPQPGIGNPMLLPRVPQACMAPVFPTVSP